MTITMLVIIHLNVRPPNKKNELEYNLVYLIRKRIITVNYSYLRVKGNDMINWVFGDILENLYYAHNWSNIIDLMIFFISLLHARHKDLYRVTRHTDPQLYLPISVKFHKSGNYFKRTIFCDISGIRTQPMSWYISMSTTLNLLLACIIWQHTKCSPKASWR